MSVIPTNTQPIEAARNLARSHELLGRSLNRLSSGSSILRPSDDSARLASSEKLGAQNRRAHAAAVNVQNVVSMVQAGDGFMRGMEKMLSRMSELAILTRDTTKNVNDVALYRGEFRALQDQLRATVGGDASEIGGEPVSEPLGAFNGIAVFGRRAERLTVAIGPAAGEEMTIPETNLRSGRMQELIQQDATGHYLVSADQPTAIETVAAAIEQMSDARAALGAVQSRLEVAGRALEVESENLAAAISRIRDVDVADESTRYAQFNILVQSGTAMLVQANQAPQSVLKLLQPA